MAVGIHSPTLPMKKVASRVSKCEKELKSLLNSRARLASDEAWLLSHPGGEMNLTLVLRA